MLPAALRLAALAALAFVSAARTPAAADAGSRTAPSRPVENVAPAARLPVTRIGNVDYLELDDAIVRLGLKGKPGRAGRKVVFGDNELVLEPDSREATINGLRVFIGEPILTRQGQLYVSKTDFEQCLTPFLRPGFGVKPLGPVKTIVLDPGHGGADDGALNASLKLTEKKLTLDVALRLQKILQTAGYKVVLTRTNDKALSPDKAKDLSLRAELANRQQADLFISIHFNVAKDARGTEIYTYTPKAQHATDWWGTLSKKDDRLELTDQPINRFDHWSAVLAEMLHRQMLKTLRTEDRGKKIAHWAVLKTLDCPGVLVEPAIISNDSEARRVATPEFRQQIADALASGIRDYVAILDSIGPKLSTPTTSPAAAPSFSR